MKVRGGGSSSIGMKSSPVVFAFAASDPTGGAGLAADIITFRARGCHALFAVTAVTAQNCDGVPRTAAVRKMTESLRLDSISNQPTPNGIRPTNAAAVFAQFDAVKCDAIRAVKIGVVGSAANARTIARAIDSLPEKIPTVWDPVTATARGDSFANPAAVTAMKTWLLPRAFVITPNRAEFFSLAEMRQGGDSAIKKAAQKLMDDGANQILITDADGEKSRRIRHLLFSSDSGGVVQLEGEWTCRRLAGKYHGSGCTFAAALTAALAFGLPLADAAADAQNFTADSLRRAFCIDGLGRQKIPRR